jgi:hypothetical protein
MTAKLRIYPVSIIVGFHSNMCQQEIPIPLFLDRIYRIILIDICLLKSVC